jgi:prepilin-type N-terminal cleavage/methylation domain-containing protein
MKRTLRGFTLVEMILVIAILGILVGITTIGWSAVSSGSRDQARAQDLKQWASTFDLYKSRYAIYPILPANPGNGIPGRTFCLGTFNQAQPVSYNGKCGQYKLAVSPTQTFDANNTETQDMLAEVKKVGNIPQNSSYAVRDAVVGPILYIEKNPGAGTSINVVAKFVNFFEGACPAGLQAETDTQIINIASGVSNVSVCNIRKTFTYDPGI